MHRKGGRAKDPCIYRDADKSLAQTGSKKATATEDF